MLGVKQPTAEVAAVLLKYGVTAQHFCCARFLKLSRCVRSARGSARRTIARPYVHWGTVFKYHDADACCIKSGERVFLAMTTVPLTPQSRFAVVLFGKHFAIFLCVRRSASAARTAATREPMDLPGSQCLVSWVLSITSFRSPPMLYTMQTSRRARRLYVCVCLNPVSTMLFNLQEPSSAPRASGSRVDGSIRIRQDRGRHGQSCGGICTNGSRIRHGHGGGRSFNQACCAERAGHRKWWWWW